MIHVRDIRRAIEGLDDDAIAIVILSPKSTAEGFDLNLEHVECRVGTGRPYVVFELLANADLEEDDLDEYDADSENDECFDDDEDFDVDAIARNFTLHGEDDYDDDMDGDFDTGMASAGFGTDEDYNPCIENGEPGDLGF